MAEAGADVAGCCGWWLFMHPGLCVLRVLSKVSVSIRVLQAVVSFVSSDLFT